MELLRRGKSLLESVVFKGPDGEEVSVSAYAIVGHERGPTVYVGAGTHGDELNGVEVCRRLARDTDPDSLKGTFCIVPIQNPVAYSQRRRLNPLDGKDLDMIYPGSKDGTATEKLATTLFGLASKAACVIDLHTAGLGKRNVPHIYVPWHVPARTGFSSLELAKAFGADVLIRTLAGVDYHFDLKHPSPYYCASSLGSAGLYVELGEGGMVEEYFVDFGVRGVRNVLKMMGMLRGKVENQGRREMLSRTELARAPASGILEKRYKLGQRVTKGDLLGWVRGVFGGSTKIRAPVTGTVYWTLTFGNVGSGDPIAWIGSN